MTNKEAAEAKISELVQSILETPANERKGVSWQVLNEWRLNAMKSKTDENGIRLAMFNMLMKQSPDEDPYLPQKVIDFLKPTIIL